MKMDYMAEELDGHSEGVGQYRLNSDSDSCDKIYIPQLRDDHKPKSGQGFESLDDAHEFYNNYAKEAGFSVRINSSRKNKETNEILRKEYVCSKEGVPTKGVGEKKRRRGITREGCKAKLAVVKSKSGTYVVSLFVEGHNHPLTSPKRVHLLRSHRTVSNSHKCITQLFSAANIPTHQQFSLLEMQVGGIENVGCLEKDIYNNERNLRNGLKGHDADMLYEHFQLEHEKNPSFTFKIEADEEDRITHCFWADTKSRKAYTFFGDVVVFDSTYNTNRYGMIFAPFVGVNNHGQTTVFACAFLSDETTNSFLWLFEQFKKAMPGDSPKMIITDQDPAMTKAIVQAFPNITHRYCSWHILDKFSERLGGVKYRDYFEDFRKCIWESESTEEFDSKWMKIVEKSESQDNDWLRSLYEIRSSWVPAYVNHVFSAGMTSSQRVESCHAFFKRYVSKNNSLTDFITRLSRALVRQRHQELSADHIDKNEKPVLKLPLEMEKQMAGTYTRKIFYEFQEELWCSLLYMVELTSETANYCVYKVKRRNNDHGSRVREIVHEKELDFASCSCKKFESQGITCRHILAFLNTMRFTYLPHQYILKRWTKTENLERVFDDDGLELNDFSEKSFLVRRTRLFQLASNVIDKAMTNEEASDIVAKKLQNALEEIKPIVDATSGVPEKYSTTRAHKFNEPLPVRAKGCGKRLKRGKEKGKSKSRRCHGCGKIGQSHDKRNCPMLKNGCDDANSNLSDTDESSFSIG